MWWTSLFGAFVDIICGLVDIFKVCSMMTGHMACLGKSADKCPIQGQDKSSRTIINTRYTNCNSFATLCSFWKGTKGFLLILLASIFYCFCWAFINFQWILLTKFVFLLKTFQPILDEQKTFLLFQNGVFFSHLLCCP
jgi:hypothetical protein